MGQRIIRKRTAKEALPRSRKRVPLTDEKREKVLSLAVDGYSIRQIAQACRASKTTVGRWLALLHDDIEKAERKRSKPTRATLGHVAVSDDMQRAIGDPPPDQNLDLGDVSQFQTEGAPEGPHLSYREGDVVEDYHPEWQFGGVRTSLGTRSRVAGPMFAIPPNYHGEKAPSPVHPFPDVPLVPNRRKGVKWYNDPNRK